MHHAMDVMIMLDTLAYDSRLDLGHLLPVRKKNICNVRVTDDMHRLEIDLY